MKSVVRIGCGAGFWGDSAEGPTQLVDSGEIDYLVLDYLAEITMSLLARGRIKDPTAGYATDFPAVLASLATRIKSGAIRVVTNAGGVNPQACKAAIEERLKALGVELKIAIVTGDDLLPRAAEFQHLREMASDSPMPPRLWSMNAYLGAFPIVAALDAGADIVITGRCVDSALALGPLIHEFRWAADDYDRLSAGSLAGHIIECGVQATGGISTDWEDCAPDWHDMGFPIVRCEASGRFTVTKPAGTGGRVVPANVAEQIVYEIGDPASYLLPDVTCDWREVRLTPLGEDSVEVTGARGRAPTDHYKVSATYQDGYRCTSMMMIGGVDAVRKAEAVAAAILRRTRRLIEARGHEDFLRTDVEILGAESNWGAHSRRRDTREVVLKLGVHHADKAALALFGRECIPSATAMSPGITGFAGGRPTPIPLVRLFSCLVPKSDVRIEVDGRAFDPVIVVAGASPEQEQPASPEPPVAPPAGARTRLRLIDIAHGRSGDKGDTANIGILARHPALLPVLRCQLTAEAVRLHLAHFVLGPVQRFEMAGLNGFNFVLQAALGGGGVASLRHDPQGKMLAQVLMDFEVDVPEPLLELLRQVDRPSLRLPTASPSFSPMEP